jgi:hypothetical protein
LASIVSIIFGGSATAIGEDAAARSKLQMRRRRAPFIADAVADAVASARTKTVGDDLTMTITIATATAREIRYACVIGALQTIRFRFVLVALVGVAVAWTSPARAAPPVPSGSHPRLFMSPDNLAAFTANANGTGKLASKLVDSCQDTITHAADYAQRTNVDSDVWPGSALRCAFAYLVTQKSQYLTQAIKFWRASLDDDAAIGDRLGCVAGVATNWSTWSGSGDPPPVIKTITHDTGYPIRWYGPDIALVYDWLSGAPGVDAGLLAQTRTCLTSWIDYYTDRGYHNDEVGANYNAGYVIGKTLSAIAIGNDGGADGHLWNETVDDLFPSLMIGMGLAGTSAAVGEPAGVLVGGDWAEGWQYGPLSVLEYAIAARAVEQSGAPLPEMDAWVNSVAVRNIYGTLPALDGQWSGGDFDSAAPYPSPSLNQLDAVLAGPSSDQAAAWAAFWKQAELPTDSPTFYNVLAELRTVAPQDYRAQTPVPSLWYLARGTRTMYVRTDWGASAFWAIFQSPPRVVSDHQHFSATNFAFTRGSDHLIVDPSPYGAFGTLNTNALTADSAMLASMYPDSVPSQIFTSRAELPWARGSQSGVFAARGDIAHAFDFRDVLSDIPYAHREWVMLPEGEIVTIDRVRTGAASRGMYVSFHANTGGTLKLSGGVATGQVGGSQVAIHQILLSGGSAAITKPPVGDCFTGPIGACISVRLAVDKYAVKVPGPYAVAIHVIDGLEAAQAAALVGSINDDNFDPPPKQNDAVVGAAVYRDSKQSYVVASSAQDGAAGSMMTFGVPGGSAGRFVVFDAPEDAAGKSLVTASADGGRCAVTIAAGDGLVGRPLMFVVSPAADGCAVTEDVDVPVGSVPPGGGLHGGGGHGGGGSVTAGCACAAAGAGAGAGGAWSMMVLLGVALSAAKRARKR